MVQYGLFQPLQDIQRVSLLCGMVLADCETFPAFINETFLSYYSPRASLPFYITCLLRFHSKAI